MNTEKLQELMVAVEGSFVEKIGEQPYINGVDLHLRHYGNWTCQLYAYTHDDGGALYGTGGTAELAIAHLEQIITELPSKKDRETQLFQAALGKLIDQGREYGIDVAYTNPLAEMAKALAENAITDQRAAK